MRRMQGHRKPKYGFICIGFKIDKIWNTTVWRFFFISSLSFADLQALLILIEFYSQGSLKRSMSTNSPVPYNIRSIDTMRSEYQPTNYPICSTKILLIKGR